MLNLRIRIATPDDVHVIADFNCCLAIETENRTLDRATVERGVRRGLQHQPEVQYWLAEVDQGVVGQLMLTREWSDWRDGWMYWLQSVYVQAEHRSQGVFRQLFQYVTKSLRNDPDVRCLRLYVEAENQIAQAAYEKLGFTSPGYHVMELAHERLTS
ncbi:MAG: N-acetyltransferase [Planctomycetaceae bacterium]